MAKQTINLGTAPTGAGGDTPRSAFVKAQANFDELYNKAASPGWSGALAGYDVPGGYAGWNSSFSTSGLYGTVDWVCNKGGGNGGFTWRSVNADNSLTGPTMSYTYEGVLKVPSILLGGRNIVEYGANANGTYTKFYDGTMICECRSSSLVACTSPAGNLFVGPTSPLTFPAAFVSQPYIIPTVYREPTNGNPIWGFLTVPANSSSQLTAVTVNLISPISGANGFSSCVAIGRWL
jgi:hypothetical protein